MANRLNHDDYTIAWIAALVVKAEAAMGMLDKSHFASERGDDYIYTRGGINGRNVVVATRLTGQNYGMGAAVALVNQVKLREHLLRAMSGCRRRSTRSMSGCATYISETSWCACPTKRAAALCIMISTQIKMLDS